MCLVHNISDFILLIRKLSLVRDFYDLGSKLLMFKLIIECQIIKQSYSLIVLPNHIFSHYFFFLTRGEFFSSRKIADCSFEDHLSAGKLIIPVRKH